MMVAEIEWRQGELARREPIETLQVRNIRVLDFLLASRYALQYDNFQPGLFSRNNPAGKG